MQNPKPIDWPRVLENPAQYTPDQLQRLDDRISKWAAVSELCQRPKELEAFDPHLVSHVRYFFALVKARHWHEAREAYQLIEQMKAEYRALPGPVVTSGKIKPKPVKAR